jgi:hypothetical protein
MVSAMRKASSSKRSSPDSSCESYVFCFGGESSIGSEFMADDCSGAEEKGDLYAAAGIVLRRGRVCGGGWKEEKEEVEVEVEER